MRVDVAVVGGGAAGLSVAWHLSERGVRSLAVIERSGLAGGATGRGAGLLSHFCWDALDAALVRRSAELYSEWHRAGETEFRRTGQYVVAAAEADAEALRPRVDVLRAAGIAVEDVHPREGARLCPDWRWDDVVAAWYVPDDATLLPATFVRRLGRVLRDRGARVLEGTPVEALAVRGSAVEGLRTAGEVGRVAADVVVVATGVWTRALLQTADLDVPIKPYRTQLSFWAVPDALHLPPLHDVTADFYWLRREGLLAVGDGTEDRESDPDAFDPEPDPAFVASARDRLVHRCPAAAGAEFVRGWAHVCDATPDRHPLLGPYGLEGLHLAVGFNGFGVMRAPAVGEAVAALVLGETPPIDVGRYAAARFDGFLDFPIRQGFNTLV